MRQFWVVGGEYESTAFRNLAEGTTEVREGPFDDYDKALKEWQRLAWETVDDCNAHFHIEEENVDFGAAGAYWVIGGTFKDTSFKEWACVPCALMQFHRFTGLDIHQLHGDVVELFRCKLRRGHG